MKKLWVLLLVACTGATEVSNTDTTLVAPVDQQVRITAPDGTNRLALEAIAPGGNANIVVAGGAGAAMELRDVPFTRADTLLVYVSPALPPRVDPWYMPKETWVYISTIGGMVLMPGTNWGEGGSLRWDSGVTCCIARQTPGQPPEGHKPGEGLWGFGGGGGPLRVAQNGFVRVRFYTR